MNAAKRYSMAAAAVAAGLFATIQQALAAIPADVTTAIDGAKTDGSSLAWSLVGLAVVVGVIFFLKRKAG